MLSSFLHSALRASYQLDHHCPQDGRYLVVLVLQHQVHLPLLNSSSSAARSSGSYDDECTALRCFCSACLVRYCFCGLLQGLRTQRYKVPVEKNSHSDPLHRALLRSTSYLAISSSSLLTSGSRQYFIVSSSILFSVFWFFFHSSNFMPASSYLLVTFNLW